MGLSSVALASFVVEVPLLIFHLIILSCVIDQIATKTSKLSKTFGLLYTVQSAFDVAVYGLIVYLYRFVPSGVVAVDALNGPLGVAIIVAVGYAIYAQNVCHALIGFNRYFAIVHPFSTVKLNHGKARIIIIAVALLAPIPGVSLRAFSQMKAIATANGYAIVNLVNWNSTATLFVATFYCIGTCIASLFFELYTLRVYRRLSPTARKEKYTDYCLLLYSLCQLVGHIALAAYYIIFIFAFQAGSTQLIASVQHALPYIVDVSSLSSGPCLFLTSVTVRRACSRRLRDLFAFNVKSCMKVHPAHGATLSRIG